MSCQRFFSFTRPLRNAARIAWLQWVCLLLAHGLAHGQPLDVFTPRPAGVQSNARPPNALYLHNRHIATFRATLLGDSPAERVVLASEALAAVLRSAERPAVTHTATPDSARFELNGRTVFFLVAADLDTPRPDAALAATSQEVQIRLEKAVAEAAELDDHLRMASDLLLCLGATLLAGWLVRCILALRVRVARTVHALLHRPAQRGTGNLVALFSEHAHMACRLVTNAVTLLAVLLTLDTWIDFVLMQFAWTRPWGEQSADWMQGVLHHFANASAAAVPGLVVAGLIFVIARMVSRANAAFMHRVQSGDIQLAWLDAHSAMATRRLCDAGVWLFAVAMAYPYLPGAETEAFKALSVIAGLMLSLGASGAVQHAILGMGLMYSRSLSVGQRVRIGDNEGTVIALGMFTARLRTRSGEDVCLPYKLIFDLPIQHVTVLTDAATPARDPGQSP